jgi:hypothetical protein
MEEFSSFAFMQKQARFEELGGYSFDVDQFLEKRKILAEAVGMTFSESVRYLFKQWDPNIQFVTYKVAAMMVTDLPLWHQFLHEEIEVQSMLYEAGFDVDQDPQSQ